MFKLFDRVKVNIATTGTGDVTFGSVSSNAFLTPTEAGCADTDTVRYMIVDGTDYEEGTGTIGNSVSTMARTTVLRSKIGGTAETTKLDLSGAAVLSLTAAAQDILIPLNNLSDLASAATARTNLGGTAVGKALFTAADEAGAQTAAGGTTVGKALFTAADEAGALAAIPSAYSKSNALGTVSQSSGVPTGSVIERGSNANGEYVKFADGTMICTTSKSVTVAINSAYGSLFTTTAITGTLPATFAATPVFSFSLDSGGGVGVRWVATSTAGTTTAWPTVFLMDGFSRASGTMTINCVAIGRWF